MIQDRRQPLFKIEANTYGHFSTRQSCSGYYDSKPKLVGHIQNTGMKSSVYDSVSSEEDCSKSENNDSHNGKLDNKSGVSHRELSATGAYRAFQMMKSLSGVNDEVLAPHKAINDNYLEHHYDGSMTTSDHHNTNTNSHINSQYFPLNAHNVTMRTNHMSEHGPVITGDSRIQRQPFTNNYGSHLSEPGLPISSISPDPQPTPYRMDRSLSFMCGDRFFASTHTVGSRRQSKEPNTNNNRGTNHNEEPVEYCPSLGKANCETSTVISVSPSNCVYNTTTGPNEIAQVYNSRNLPTERIHNGNNTTVFHENRRPQRSATSASEYNAKQRTTKDVTCDIVPSSTPVVIHPTKNEWSSPEEAIQEMQQGDDYSEGLFFPALSMSSSVSSVARSSQTNSQQRQSSSLCEYSRVRQEGKECCKKTDNKKITSTSRVISQKRSQTSAVHDRQVKALLDMQRQNADAVAAKSITGNGRRKSPTVSKPLISTQPPTSIGKCSASRCVSPQIRASHTPKRASRSSCGSSSSVSIPAYMNPTHQSIARVSQSVARNSRPSTPTSCRRGTPCCKQQHQHTNHFDSNAKNRNINFSTSAQNSKMQNEKNKIKRASSIPITSRKSPCKPYSAPSSLARGVTSAIVHRKLSISPKKKAMSNIPLTSDYLICPICGLGAVNIAQCYSHYKSSPQSSPEVRRKSSSPSTVMALSVNRARAAVHALGDHTEHCLTQRIELDEWVSRGQSDSISGSNKHSYWGTGTCVLIDMMREIQYGRRRSEAAIATKRSTPTRGASINTNQTNRNATSEAVGLSDECTNMDVAPPVILLHKYLFSLASTSDDNMTSVMSTSVVDTAEDSLHTSRKGVASSSSSRPSTSSMHSVCDIDRPLPLFTGAEGIIERQRKRRAEMAESISTTDSLTRYLPTNIYETEIASKLSLDAVMEYNNRATDLAAQVTISSLVRSVCPGAYCRAAGQVSITKVSSCDAHCHPLCWTSEIDITSSEDKRDTIHQPVFCTSPLEAAAIHALECYPFVSFSFSHLFLHLLMQDKGIRIDECHHSTLLSSDKDSLTNNISFRLPFTTLTAIWETVLNKSSKSEVGSMTRCPSTSKRNNQTIIQSLLTATLMDVLHITIACMLYTSPSEATCAAKGLDRVRDFMVKPTIADCLHVKAVPLVSDDHGIKGSYGSAYVQDGNHLDSQSPIPLNSLFIPLFWLNFSVNI